MMATNVPRESQNTSVPIVVPNENHEITSDFEEFERILLRDDIKDRDVIVVSIAGAPRKGKSFLMNFCAHYLHSKYSSSSPSDWLKSDGNLSSGFIWRRGTTKVTNGIQMWPEIFCATLKGKKVAIVLLDTQGTFDKDCTVKESVIIFALSTILSSIQIYNVSSTIEGHDLQHLQLFTEYGKVAQTSKNSEIPFQKFQFLVRDWCFPDEHEYGAKGGKEFLESVLKTSDNQPEELQQIRKLIKSSFSDIQCFLMPEPGQVVKCDAKFDGKISDIEPAFLDNLREFIPSLLAPENLVVKKIGNQKMKVKDFVKEFQSYVNLFTNFDSLPEPKTLLMSIVELNLKSALKEAVQQYNNEMNKYCEDTNKFLDINASLNPMHEKCKSHALKFFKNSKCKMGGDEIHQKFTQELEKDIDSEYQEISKKVQTRNEFIVSQNCEKAHKEGMNKYQELLANKSLYKIETSNYRELYTIKEKHVYCQTQALKTFDLIAINIGETKNYLSCRNMLQKSFDTMHEKDLDEAKNHNELMDKCNCEKALSETLSFYQTIQSNKDKQRVKRKKALTFFDNETIMVKDKAYRACVRTDLEQKLKTMMENFAEEAKKMKKGVLENVKNLGVTSAVLASPLMFFAPMAAGVAAASGVVVALGSMIADKVVDGEEEDP